MQPTLSPPFRRFVVAFGLSTVALIASGCPTQPGSGTAPGTTSPTTSTTATTSTLPTGNRAPLIGAFAASNPTGAVPLTTAFTWSISDPDGDPLTCLLDADGDAVVDKTVIGCTSSSVRAATVAMPGAVAASLRVSDGVAEAAALTTVTPSPAGSDGFSITIRINGSMTPSQRDAFSDAASRWAEVIRGGLPDTVLNVAANACNTGAAAFSGAVDDVMIDATVAPIDGAGDILGQAGPCRLRSTSGLPVYGVMSFDSADVEALKQDGDFDAVILHEMGHVLGIGTLWSGRGLVGAGSSDPSFSGIVARSGWQDVGGIGNVPVENSGGPGTADSHWREVSLQGELMTGYIDHNDNPLSAITVGACADLGYVVDLGAADPYGRPRLRRGESGISESEALHTQPIVPSGTVPG